MYDRYSQLTFIVRNDGAKIPVHSLLVFHHRVPVGMMELRLLFIPRLFSTTGCQFDLTADTGRVVSPGYQSDLYPNILQCEWTIQVQAGRTLTLTFSPSFSLEDGKDFLQVRCLLVYFNKDSRVSMPLANRYLFNVNCAKPYATECKHAKLSTVPNSGGKTSQEQN